MDRKTIDLLKLRAFLLKEARSRTPFLKRELAKIR